MIKLWECTVCGLLYEGDIPDNCPRCGAPKEKFVEVASDKIGRIERARFTNQLHCELYGMLSKIMELAEKGINDNLDPGCLTVFKVSLEQAKILQQMVKAEIETHVKKEKWG